jgi:hypothetical protein
MTMTPRKNTVLIEPPIRQRRVPRLSRAGRTTWAPWGPAGDHTCRAVPHDGSVPARYAPCITRMTCGSAQPFLTGGQGVAGSNPAVPTQVRRLIRTSDQVFGALTGDQDRGYLPSCLLDGRSRGPRITGLATQRQPYWPLHAYRSGRVPTAHWTPLSRKLSQAKNRRPRLPGVRQGYDRPQPTELR